MPIKTISGFDLSLFNKFQIENEYQTVHLANEEYLALSTVTFLKSYDFYDIPPAIQDNEPQHDLLTFTIQQAGEGQALFCFPSPKAVKTGDELKIKLIHSDQLMSFELVS